MMHLRITSCDQKYGVFVSREVDPVFASSFLAVIQNKAGKELFKCLVGVPKLVDIALHTPIYFN